MNTINQKILKLKKVAILFYGLLLLGCQDKILLELETFKTEKGWGYQIKKNERIFIHQTTIPAVAGNHYFVCLKDANNTGNLMLKKLKQGKHPAISLAELDSMNVRYTHIVEPD